MDVNARAPVEFMRLWDTFNEQKDDEFVPFHKHCFVCGKLGKFKCSKCQVSRYCSRDCQLSHWKVHKRGCGIDAGEIKPPKFEAKMFCFDPSCYHGAPEPDSEYAELAESVINFMSLLTREKLECNYALMSDADKFVLEIDACRTYCREFEQFARMSQAPQILHSMALEAFMDSNGGTCREFLRCAVFFESFAVSGWKFVSCMLRPADLPESEVEPTDAGYVHYREFLNQTMSRKGLVEFLKARITCGCMKEKAGYRKN